MRIIYLFDPLCGWCYGAAPALDGLAGRDGVTLELAPTGLFADGGARSMDAGFAAYAWQNDQRIAALTGQPFSETYRREVLGRGGRFDSGPATLGLIAAGSAGRHHERPALAALQRARYQDGLDTSRAEVVAEVLDVAGFAEAAAAVRAPDAALAAAGRARIAEAHATMARLGVNGVPALAVAGAEGLRLVPGALLFGPLDDLLRAVGPQAP